MTARLRQRGPDGEGQYFSEPAPGSGSGESWRVSLGHRRLSIIDLEGGAQPLGNETGRVQIVFNGEIFNFRSLRPELERLGHVFRTRSDTEVIVHHYEQYGEEGLRSLNGMFAFALWDQDHGRLVLARDRAGIKPLYYARLKDGGIAFASELTSLIQHPELRAAQLDASALSGYFFSDYIAAPQTLFEGVFKLEPGHFLIWERGELNDPRAFWRVEELAASPEEQGSLADHESRLEELLDASVERQLIADVPVGIFLSGGIDSSLVAAFARRKSGSAIRTFSIAFDDPDYDESAYARLVARHLGTEHQEKTLSEAKLLANLDAALDCLDEPLADPSVIPTFLLSRLTSATVKVALGGDAGDELFAGYPTYRAHGFARYYEMLPAVLRKRVIGELVARLPVNLTYQSFEWKAKRFALRWDDEPLRRHLRWMSALDLPELGELFPERHRPQIFGEPQVLREARRLGSLPSLVNDPVNAFLALDFVTYLPGSVLSKVDRASMGNGLEVRPPLLDNEIVEWAFSLPGSLKLRGGVSKFLLKRVARKHLPEAVVSRKKKGFGIPLGRWLRGPLQPRLEAILRDSPVWPAGLRRETFVRWSEEHGSGEQDRSKPLWALIVLDQWMRRERQHA